MSDPQRIRWWPGIAIAILGAAAFLIIRTIDVWPYEQARTLAILSALLFTAILLALWWLFFSIVFLVSIAKWLQPMA